MHAYGIRSNLAVAFHLFRRHDQLTNHHYHLYTAFTQLSFAIKFLTYLENHHIALADFDNDLSIQSFDGIVRLPHNEFQTYEALLIAAENNVSIAFGATSITIWEAIREQNF